MSGQGQKHTGLFLARRRRRQGLTDLVVKTAGPSAAKTAVEDWLFPANAGGGVTVALTGQVYAASSGTLTASGVLPLSGQLATYGQGTVTPSVGGGPISVALTGQSISYAQGVIAAAVGKPLTGQAVGYAQGALAPAVSAVLVGQVATYSQGTLSQVLSASLAGLSSTHPQGTLAAAIDKALGGQSAAYSQGDLGVINESAPVGSGGGGSAPGGMLHRYKLLQAFKDKQERDEAVSKLPKASERERVVLRKSARALIKSEPVNYKELETRVSKDLESIGLAPAPNHLDWLLYFLRVEAHAIAQAQKIAQEDEDLMQVLLMALME